MSRETNYLLGTAIAVLAQARSHMIRKQDVEGVELIEEQYQALQRGIDAFYYGRLTEKVDGKRKQGN